MRMTTCTIDRKVYKHVLLHFLMEDADVKAGLRSLRQSLRQIKALLVWEQLKQSEARPHLPPAFHITDFTETDLENEYSFFLSTSLQIRSLLSDRSIPILPADRQSIEKQLAIIEHQAYGLNLGQRFCECQK